jgi:YD repeat-containing protein
VKSIKAGDSFSVALKSDGTVWTWGNNGKGQLGYQGVKQNMPMHVEGIDDVIFIAAGQAHTVALKSDGTVWTWGYNLSGQLGRLTDTDMSSDPVKVEGIDNVISITVSNSSIKI